MRLTSASSSTTLEFILKKDAHQLGLEIAEIRNNKHQFLSPAMIEDWKDFMGSQLYTVYLEL